MGVKYEHIFYAHKGVIFINVYTVNQWGGGFSREAHQRPPSTQCPPASQHPYTDAKALCLKEGLVPQISRFATTPCL